MFTAFPAQKLEAQRAYTAPQPTRRKTAVLHRSASHTFLSQTEKHESVHAYIPQKLYMLSVFGSATQSSIAPLAYNPYANLYTTVYDASTLNPPSLKP